MTPRMCCGFECGVAGTGTMTSPHWISSGTTALTFSTTTVRTGARSLRCNSAAATCYGVSRPNAILSGQGAVRVYVRFATLPSANTMLIKAGGALGADQVGAYFNASDSKIYARWNDGSGASGVSVTTDQWYLFEVKITATACDVSVNGTAAGQASTGSASTSNTIELGFRTAVTGDVFFDDFLSSGTSGDSPLGAGYVNHFVPTSDGTHNIAGTADFQRGNTAVDILNATTTAWQLVDDVPLPSGAVNEADNQRAVAPPNATNYVECVFGPASGVSTPTQAPQSVHAVLAYHAIATGTGNIRVALNDNGTTDDVLNFTGAGVVTYQYAHKHYALAPTGGAWTVTAGAGNFNNIRCRFYSSDAAPDQCLDAIMIEAAFAEGGDAATSVKDLIGGGFIPFAR